MNRLIQFGIWITPKAKAQFPSLLKKAKEEGRANTRNQLVNLAIREFAETLNEEWDMPGIPNKDKQRRDPQESRDAAAARKRLSYWLKRHGAGHVFSLDDLYYEASIPDDLRTLAHKRLDKWLLEGKVVGHDEGLYVTC